MTSLNPLYKSYMRKCLISSYEANFPLKRTMHSFSSFIWRNFNNNVGDVNIFSSKPGHSVKRNRSTTFKRRNSSLAKIFRLQTFLPVQIQQGVRLYSSGKEKKENTVLETFIETGSTVQKEEIHSMTYRKVMRNVPQPIVLLTSAIFRADTNSWLKRGITCSSLLSVSLKPPILSFCLNRPSRMHDLLLQSQRFAINILGKNQAKFSDLFSSPAQDNLDQFAGISHHLSKEGLPVLVDTPVLLCRTHSVHNVGDHSVWYGMVTGTLHEDKMIEPVLHYCGSYHSIGERILTLPRCVFTQGPVISRLQVAWQCVKNRGQDCTLLCMKEMFQKQFQSKEKDWHETIAMFYLNAVSKAMKTAPNFQETFEEFLQRNPTLTELNDHLLQCYTAKIILSPEAKEKYVPPDRKDRKSVV